MILEEIIFAITQRIGARQTRKHDRESAERHGGGKAELAERQRRATEKYAELLKRVS